MATRVQFRRGTTAQHANFTGAVGEVTVDTDKEVVVVHDGTLVGGYPLASAVMAQTFTKAQRGAITALTSATTVTPDFALANNFSLTLAHNVVLANPTNQTAGQGGGCCHHSSRQRLWSIHGCVRDQLEVPRWDRAH